MEGEKKKKVKQRKVERGGNRGEGKKTRDEGRKKREVWREGGRGRKEEKKRKRK